MAGWLWNLSRLCLISKHPLVVFMPSPVFWILILNRRLFGRNSVGYKASFCHFATSLACISAKKSVIIALRSCFGAIKWRLFWALMLLWLIKFSSLNLKERNLKRDNLNWSWIALNLSKKSLWMRIVMVDFKTKNLKPPPTFIFYFKFRKAISQK